MKFGGTDYVFAGGRAFLASGGELAAVRKVDKATLTTAPAGIAAPTKQTLRAGTLLSTTAVDGNATVYVAGTDGELHGFSTSAQFVRDGYDAAFVVTVPSLGGLRIGTSAGVAGQTVTALATRADGALVDSSGTYYLFAGGKAFGISTAQLVEVERADNATVLHGNVGSTQTSAPMASGVLLSTPRTVYVSYDGSLYPFKTLAQLATDGYGGTGAVPVSGTGGLTVLLSYNDAA